MSTSKVPDLTMIHADIHLAFLWWLSFRDFGSCCNFGISCLYVDDILLPPLHTHDDAHGLVPTRLTAILVTFLHIYLLRLIINMI
jgi:hypothetical protein